MWQEICFSTRCSSESSEEIVLPWLAHLTFPLVLKRLYQELALKWLLIGALLPDWFLIGKALVYSGMDGRGVPLGLGHTLLVPLLIGVFLNLSGIESRSYVSFIIGAWSHIFLDTLDSKGVLLFFPFVSKHVAFNVWQYTGQYGFPEDLLLFYANPNALLLETTLILLAFLYVLDIIKRR